MQVGQSIGAILLGLIGSLIGGTFLYLCLHKDTPPLRIWWIPKEMENRDAIERLIIGIIATGFIVVGLAAFVLGCLALLR
jgi:hypothetical protein